MCNEKNVQDAINVMERARKFDLSTWQEGADFYAITTEAELNSCGMAACFGGYIAVSPEFKAAGGEVSRFSGRPIICANDFTVGGHEAIAVYLGINDTLAAKLTACTTYEDGENDGYNFYGKSIKDVTKEDVIEKLKLILSGELK